ncbi:MAG: hypothetical protein LBK03_03930, partial [Bacteroidales bacterium]|nr:hypothetical protein [Bacteroidales bacterium]
AKDKTNHDISADTVITYVADYYLWKKDFPKATLAAFYCGRVWSERKDDKLALQAYLEAARLAANTTDGLLKGKIAHNTGYIYYTSGTEYQKAIGHFRIAAGLFSAENHDVFTLASLQLLGICFLLQNQPDSAVLYQQQALNIAAASHDTTAYANLLNSFSVTYRTKHDYLQAKIYALQAAAIVENRENLLNLAIIYYNLHENDSAACHAHRVKQLYEQDSLPLPASLYRLLSDIAKQRRQFKTALSYQEQYTQQVLEINEEEKERSIAGIREKYDMTQVENENQRLQSQHSRIKQLILLAAILILFLFFLWKRRQKKRLKQIQHDRDQLFEQHLSSFKKAGLLEQQLMKLEQDKEKREKICKKVHQIYYDAKEGLSWDQLYSLINSQYHGRFERIRQLFPELTELEFKIACMEYNRFKNNEMAACLKCPQNTITTRKTTLHKKIGFTGKDDFRVHFDKLTG